MFLTGFADEAATDLAGQIRATQALGWRHIEARAIDGVNIHDLPDETFDRVCGQLADAGITINAFGSTIANWGRRITDPFEPDLEAARRAIARMQRLGVRMIRIMSYAVLEERAPDDQMVEERVRRLRELTALFLDNGITPLHENCMNYGGMGWRYTLTLIERVPGLRLVFDTGNPVFAADRMRSEPWPRQSSWEFYSHVREHVVHVHVKDCRWDGELGRPVYTWPGEGDGDVRRILADLLARGYDGGISIEPHVAAVFHDPNHAADAQTRFDSYVEYGRRLARLLHELRGGTAEEV